MMEEMESYLSALTSQKHPDLDGKSVAEILRKRFLSQRSSKVDRQVFEFLMSYRWG